MPVVRGRNADRVERFVLKDSPIVAKSGGPGLSLLQARGEVRLVNVADRRDFGAELHEVTSQVLSAKAAAYHSGANAVVGPRDSRRGGCGHAQECPAIQKVSDHSVARPSRRAALSW